MVAGKNVVPSPISIKLKKENQLFNNIVKQILPIEQNKKTINYKLLEVAKKTWEVIGEVEKLIVENGLLPNYNNNHFTIRVTNKDVLEIKNSYESWKNNKEDNYRIFPHIVQNKKTKKHNINIPVIYGGIFDSGLDGIENIDFKGMGNLENKYLSPNREVLRNIASTKEIDEEKIQKSYLTLSLLHEIGHVFFFEIMEEYSLKNKEGTNLTLKGDFIRNLNESFADTFALLIHSQICKIDSSFCSQAESIEILKALREDFNNKYKNMTSYISPNDIRFIEINSIIKYDTDYGNFVNRSFCASFINSCKLLAESDEKNQIKGYQQTLNVFLEDFFNLKDINKFDDIEKLTSCFSKNKQVQNIEQQLIILRDTGKISSINKSKL